MRHLGLLDGSNVTLYTMHLSFKFLCFLYLYLLYCVIIIRRFFFLLFCAIRARWSVGHAGNIGEAMHFSINCLGLIFIKLQNLLRLPNSFLTVHHFLYFCLLDKVFATFDFILDDLIFLDQSFILLAHCIVLFGLCCLLRMRSTKLNAYFSRLNTINLPLILFIFNLFQLLGCNLLI